jgi:hypothetical protein
MIKVFEKFDAVQSLVGGELSQPADGVIRYHSGQTPPSDSAISTEVVRLQAEYDALEYARNRQAEYPDYGTQLNKIYDDGLTKWKAEMVDPIKAKYPKP